MSTPEPPADLIDGLYATVRATLSVMGFNPKLVKPEEAPKGFRDLLDPRLRKAL